MKKKYPIVAVVGRTNVGKSTLFNRLSSGVKSIVFDAPGVTRDFVTDEVSWQGRHFELVDTGGVSFERSDDLILQEVKNRALECIERAAVVLFVCDGSVGLLPEDRTIAKMLHKSGKTVAIIVNKMDTKDFAQHQFEFEKLGFKATIPVSALHSKGIVDILEFIVAALPTSSAAVEQERVCKVVLLGKPNVGKSSLLNLLLQQERMIVSSVPGTTRDTVSEAVRFYQEDIMLTDTPGLRKKRSVEHPLEQLMTKGTLRAVKNADVILLMVDASAGTLVDQELKLAFYVFEQQHKALIIIFNKQDLLLQDAYAQQTLKQNIELYDFLTDKVEQLTISCKTGENVGKIMPLVQKVWERYNKTFDDIKLTVLFKEALTRKPLYRNQQLLEVYKAKQIRTAPPTILLSVNNPEWFGPSQLGYFEKQLRQQENLKSIPIVFVSGKK